ncbi:hypothetical protein ACWDV4_13970 [Micromonospora sp. NPDC003197]
MAQPSTYDPSMFGLEVMVQLLASPDPGGFSCGIPLKGAWDEPESVTGYEPIMEQVRQRIEEDAVPFFARYGSLGGYLLHLRERIDGDAANGIDVLDINVAEELLYVHLVRGDRASAAAAAQQAERSAEQNRQDPIPSPWVDDVLARIRRVMAADRQSPEKALSMLAETATTNSAALALPPPQLRPATDR